MRLAMIFCSNNKVIHWAARSMEDVSWNIREAKKQGFESQYRVINLKTYKSEDFFIEDEERYFKEFLKEKEE